MNKEYFNYGKKSYYVKDYNTKNLNKKKLKKSLKKVKRTWQKNNQQTKAATAKSTSNHNNFNIEPYPSGQAFMTCTSDK